MFLCGQIADRPSQYVRDPLTATALAIESVIDGRCREQALIISCDLVVITRELQQRLRVRLQAGLPEFDADKLIVCATHTHNAPFQSYRQFERMFGGRCYPTMNPRRQ